jgi:4'-phosphopantetheinyl transferase
MEVRWLEQSLADVSEQDDWLGPRERSHLETLRFPKRRADWRLGRWTAKHAVACDLNLSPTAERLAYIEIRSAASGAPEVFLGNHPANLTISISHRAGIAACAVGESGAMLGCDLEIVEPRSDAFVSDYFTAEEQEVVRQACPADRFTLIALIWSAKESALKALHAGLRIDTRSLSVVLDDANMAVIHGFQPAARDDLAAIPHSSPLWRTLRVNYIPQHIFQGWWFRCADRIRTGVSLPPTPRPTWSSFSQRGQPQTLTSMEPSFGTILDK